ncbi:hypothetical protein D3C75_1171220 [compost metagenome]
MSGVFAVIVLMMFFCFIERFGRQDWGEDRFVKTSALFQCSFGSFSNLALLLTVVEDSRLIR